MRTLVAENRAGASAPALKSRFAAFAWGVLIYNVAVILWGALVRATGSGAGCGGHWPLCNGDVLPDISQIGTVIELTHRIMSGISMVLVAVMWIWARNAYSKGHQARRWAAWSIVFILTEALLGASLVLLGHVAKDESIGRVYSLAAHLVNTFLLLASLALTAWYAARPEIGVSTGREKRPFTGADLGLLAALVLVAVAGAITALGDTLFPTHTFAQGLRDDFSSTASFLIRLRVIHPILAVAAGFLIVMVAFPEFRSRYTAKLRTLSACLLALLAAQIAIGGASILLHAPVPIQLLHLGVADAIWITLVLFTAERLETPAAVRK